MALLPDNSLTDTGATAAVEADLQPNKTYKMLVDESRISGTLAKDIAAVEQAAYKILNTERYKHVIYSWNYGAELQDLFGKPMPWVLSEIPRRIREALVQDDRIRDVTDFNLTYDKKGNVLALFTIKSIYGDITAQKGVNIA